MRRRRLARLAPLVRAISVLVCSTAIGSNAAHVRVHVKAAGDICCTPPGTPTTTAPMLTTVCPAICHQTAGNFAVCVYYPANATQLCVTEPKRACYFGSSCAVQCVPAEPMTVDAQLMVSLYSTTAGLERITTANAEDPRTLAINATLVASIGPLRLEDKIDKLYLVANEPASDFLFFDSTDADDVDEGSSSGQDDDATADDDDVDGGDDDDDDETEVAWLDDSGSSMDDEGAMLWDDSDADADYDEEAYDGTNDVVLGANDRVDMTFTPSFWSDLAGLTTLRIENLILPALDKRGLQELPEFSRLENLILVNNGLRGLPLPRRKLPLLFYLDLSNNPLGLVPNDSLPLDLDTLMLNDVQLAHLPADLRAMRNLTCLAVRDNPHLGDFDAKMLPRSITALYVSNCSLSRLPVSLPRLEALDSLILTSNNLQSATDFSVLPARLTSLEAADCRLETIPNGLRKLQALKYLDLSQNAFKTIDAALFPEQLNKLLLDGCNIRQIPVELPKFRKLRVLSLEDNPVEAMVSECFPPGLHALYMSSFLVTVIPNHTIPVNVSTLVLTKSALDTVPGDVHKLRGLVSLEISFSNLSSFPVTSNMQTLNNLSLAGNYLKEFQARLPQFQQLNLSKNQLSSLELNDATALTDLDLSGNNFTEIPACVFALPSLTALDISNNPIANYSPNSHNFSFLKQLTWLKMDQTQFASDCDKLDTLKSYSVCTGINRTEIIQRDSRKPSNNHTLWLVLVNVLLALVLCVVVAVVWYRRKLHSEELKKQELLSKNVVDLSVWKGSDLLKHRVEFDLVTKERLIASGMFGQVWQATYKGRVVAVKSLKDADPPRQLIQQFVDEITLMSKFRHPKVVAFLGVAWTKESDVIMLTEFMENGTLRTYLERTPVMTDGWDACQLRIAIDIAEALVYLHSLNPVLIHRDLKSMNVLLDRNLNAKLSDFGISKHKMDDETMTSCVGTVRWIAPEVLEGRNYDESADIYSFGIILSELDTHELPYHDARSEDDLQLSDSAIAHLVMSGSLTASFTKACPSAIVALAQRCSAHRAEDRPTAVTVAFELRQLLKQSEAQAMSPIASDNEDDFVRLDASGAVV